MNDNTHTPSELLNDYLDGELDSVRESVLFRLLADDQDLRTEMRDFLAVRAYVQRDSDSITPPGRLKNTVLAAVDGPAAGIAEAQDGKRKSAWLLLILLPFLSALVGSVFTLAFLSERGAPVTALSGANVQNAPLAAATTAENTEYAHMMSAATDGYVVEEVNAPGPADDPPVSAYPTPDPESALSASPGLPAAAAGSAPVEQEPITALFPATVKSTAAGFGMRPIAHSGPPGTADRFDGFSIMPPAPGDGPSAFSLSLRGSVLGAWPDVPTQSNSDPWFQDMALGLFYDIDSRHAFGFELGQEQFSQRFSGVFLGEAAVHEQKPLLFWIGGAYQYSGPAIGALGGIQPFGRIVAAGTRTGPLMKGILGLRFVPESRIALSLGLEAGYLAYRHQGQWFSSRKVGISYGMSVKF